VVRTAGSSSPAVRALRGALERAAADVDREPGTDDGSGRHP